MGEGEEKARLSPWLGPSPMLTSCLPQLPPASPAAAPLSLFVPCLSYSPLQTNRQTGRTSEAVSNTDHDHDPDLIFDQPWSSDIPVLSLISTTFPTHLPYHHWTRAMPAPTPLTLPAEGQGTPSVTLNHTQGEEISYPCLVSPGPGGPSFFPESKSELIREEVSVSLQLLLSPLLGLWK